MPLSRNLGTLTSWNLLGYSRPVTGLLYLYVDFLLVPVRGGVHPRAIALPEGLCPMITTGIESQTFRLVAQFLKQVHHRISSVLSKPLLL